MIRWLLGPILHTFVCGICGTSVVQGKCPRRGRKHQDGYQTRTSFDVIRFGARWVTVPVCLECEYKEKNR